MRLFRRSITLSSLSLLVACVVAAQTAPAPGAAPTQSIQSALNQDYSRDAHQSINKAYSAKIKQYTTEPRFLSPLVEYLPASSTVPTPAKVLGDVAGAPDMLPYAEDVYKYMRMLEESSPRVRVVSIGKTEEGREMIAVAIADPALLKDQKENDARLARLADPRTIGMDDKKAQPLIDSSFTV